jgi:hypothetical protein
MSSEADQVPASVGSIGVINPYALAELVRGRSIDWEEEEAPTVLEETLGRPYEELFDPKYRSPLYPGLEVTDAGEVRVRGLDDLDLEVELEEAEPERTDPDVSRLERLADFTEVLDVEDLRRLEIRNPEVVSPGTLRLDVRLPEEDRRVSPFRTIPRDVLESITELVTVEEGWTPPNAAWSDPGDFFEETAEFHDPIQGAVANCYYIAALSAVAWAMPYRISHRTRATGEPQPDFVDMVEFYSGGSSTQIEVSETVPLRTPGNAFMYARSSEPGEIWPAVYEKAYAKWKTGTGSDRPQITATAYGDPVRAASELTGLTRHYYATSSTSANDLWDRVRANSRSYKTINPMVAWTYGSAASAPTSINYSTANIVANHAYTVLGWAYSGGTKYIVVRNPWGNTEATTGAMSGVWTSYDESFWRSINLPDVDGSFAVDANTFKQYFAGLGVVD